MHKITEKEFSLKDFSCEHLTTSAKLILQDTISALNESREWYLKYDFLSENDKRYFIKGINNKKDLWWQIIQLLPSSYNQKRTITLDYETVINQYYGRKNHKLDEWHYYCDWIVLLPYMKDFLDLKQVDMKKNF